MNNGLLHRTNMVKYNLLGYRIDDGCYSSKKNQHGKSQFCYDVQEFSLVSFPYKKEEYLKPRTNK